jgi:pimeloyl-ACP methyl ester carboxylesterase
MEERPRFAEVNGTRLAYQESGAGYPVVLIHGFSLDQRMWDDQVPELERRFRVIRYDMRGYGHSDPPGPEPYVAAGDLRALLEHLHVERAVIIGLSMGGTVALQFAQAYPTMAQALVLVDSALSGWTSLPEWSTEWRRIVTLGREKGVEEAREAWLASSLFAPAMGQPGVAARLRTMVSDISGFHFIHRDSQEWPDPPALARLGEIRCPALVIVGERDVPEFLAIADVLAERITGAEKVVIPGAGHMANMEAPRQVNEAIMQFLSKTLPTATA